MRPPLTSEGKVNNAVTHRMRFCNGVTVELDKGRDTKGKVSQPPIPPAKPRVRLQVLLPGDKGRRESKRPSGWINNTASCCACGTTAPTSSFSSGRVNHLSKRITVSGAPVQHPRERRPSRPCFVRCVAFSAGGRVPPSRKQQQAASTMGWSRHRLASRQIGRARQSGLAVG